MFRACTAAYEVIGAAVTDAVATLAAAEPTFTPMGLRATVQHLLNAVAQDSALERASERAATPA
jgi:hypothetical protein